MKLILLLGERTPTQGETVMPRVRYCSIYGASNRRDVLLVRVPPRDLESREQIVAVQGVVLP